MSTTSHATDAWYREVQDYDWENPGIQKGTGHFTQVVWKDCKKVGFGFAGIYVVGRYMPPGNVKG